MTRDVQKNRQKSVFWSLWFKILITNERSLCSTGTGTYFYCMAFVSIKQHIIRRFLIRRSMLEVPVSTSWSKRSQLKTGRQPRPPTVYLTLAWSTPQQTTARERVRRLPYPLPSAPEPTCPTVFWIVPAHRWLRRRCHRCRLVHHETKRLDCERWPWSLMLYRYPTCFLLSYPAVVQL